MVEWRNPLPPQSVTLRIALPKRESPNHSLLLLNGSLLKRAKRHTKAANSFSCHTKRNEFRQCVEATAPPAAAAAAATFLNDSHLILRFGNALTAKIPTTATMIRKLLPSRWAVAYGAIWYDFSRSSTNAMVLSM